MKIHHALLTALAACLMAINITSCSKDEEEPCITVSPEKLYFKGSEKKQLQFRSTYKMPCNYHMVSHPNWLGPDFVSGAIYNEDYIVFTSESHLVEVGQTSGELVFATDFGTITVPVFITKPDPDPFHLPDSVIFPPGIDEAVLEINNPFSDNYYYYLSCYTNKIHFSPVNGWLMSGQPEHITISVEPDIHQYYNNYPIKVKIDGIEYEVMLYFQRI